MNNFGCKKPTDMKQRLIPLLIAAMTFTGCGTSSSVADGGPKTSRQEKTAADFEQLVTLIEGGNYQFLARSASPSGGRTIQLTSEYTMEARDGVYQAHLPYFGRAYQASYGGDGGIEFSGEPENLEITRNDRKNTLSVSFVVKTDKDLYTLKLEVGASGFGTLMVSSQNRQNISYYGQAGELKP